MCRWTHLALEKCRRNGLEVDVAPATEAALQRNAARLPEQDVPTIELQNARAVQADRVTVYMT